MPWVDRPVHVLSAAARLDYPSPHVIAIDRAATSPAHASAHLGTRVLCYLEQRASDQLCTGCAHVPNGVSDWTSTHEIRNISAAIGKQHSESFEQLLDAGAHLLCGRTNT